MKLNDEIKRTAQQAGIKLWQVAARLGLNDGNFSRKLRFEFSDEMREKIFKIIEELRESR